MIKFLLFIFFAFNIAINALANPNLKARIYILVDYHSDEVLFELDPDAQIYPANDKNYDIDCCVWSIKNKLSLDDKITVSENAWRLSQAGYSSMFIMINDQVSVEDLLKGIIIA